MKTPLLAPALRVFSVSAFFLVGIAGFSRCAAQSIVGKWHRESARTFVDDKATEALRAAAAQQQKMADDAVRANAYKETVEFKSDGTFIKRVTAKGTEPKVQNEHYSFSGDKLEMGISPTNSLKANVIVKSLSVRKMIWDWVYRGMQREVTYSRM